MLEAEGHAAISEMVAGVQAKFPFRRRSGVDTHHDQLRFAWDLVNPEGTVVVAGIDIGALASDGRLRRITGSSARSRPRPRHERRPDHPFTSTHVTSTHGRRPSP